MIQETDHTPYDDIINLPYRKSDAHPHMTNLQRAAQFSPFASLTGYYDTLEETGRLTDSRIFADEGVLDSLDRIFNELMETSSHPILTITYFKQDPLKGGGSYETYTGELKKADPVSGVLTFRDGTAVNAADIMAVASDQE
ncbi:MAG: hypothetical protein IIY77_00820 [Lachnospiraceae bacterium]|nr:hypothetical protein [Lachnospiraceae bacterium]